MITQKENPPQRLTSPRSAERTQPEEVGSKCYYFNISWPTVDSWRTGLCAVEERQSVGLDEVAACDEIAAEGFAMLDAEEARIGH
jgi:hypothetical protein